MRLSRHPAATPGRKRLARYLIRLLNARGERHAMLEREHQSDDEAIDPAGFLDHPHALEVWDGERLVARFPPKRK